MYIKIRKFHNILYLDWVSMCFQKSERLEGQETSDEEDGEHSDKPANAAGRGALIKSRAMSIT